ncbi:sensor histidine kinase [Rhodopila sp.]|uniref:sensor histidine kinase n=1 Tax=Rhodopila sp. TaxID=2480087 RepID=UPI003D10CD22
MGSDQQHLSAEDAAHELTRLRLLVDDLRQAVQARDDFIAIAAHELRNPMTPLQGFAELALASARAAEGTCPPRVTAMLERMQFAISDFIRRATSLLDVRRIEADNLQLKPSATDLSALVISVVERYELNAAHGGSPLRLDIAGGISGKWDRLAVEQVIENLLSNALKFGMGRSVNVRLGSHETYACIEVQDFGIGMRPDQQALIFGRFEQVVTQHRGSGFGIGLWVAARLVDAMGGRITVDSRPGEGSMFSVMLPLEPPKSGRQTK